MADETVSQIYAVVTREDARLSGLISFYTGTACRHGHMAERSVKDGKCRACVRERNLKAHYANLDERRAKQKQYRTHNAGSVRAQQNAWKAANQDHVKSRKSAWYYRNRERLTIKNAAYRIEKAIELAAQQSAWQKANPDKVRARCHRRRARLRMALGSFSSDDVQRIYRLQKGRCAICSEKVGRKYDLDHIQPLSKGGSNYPRNLQITCRRCNARKNALDPIDFAQRNGLLL